MGDGDPVEIARAMIEEITYMTLATVDEDGLPWASPVWFAHAYYTEFVWISRPDSRHSQNLAVNPQLAIVIFDSRVPIDTGGGVYLDARAEQVTDDAEIDRVMATFSERSVAQGGGEYTAADVTGESHLRPYRATPTTTFLGVNDRRIEVSL
jgi:pyridoxine/pyridoxamine 5'-phosphate oxidase